MKAKKIPYYILLGSLTIGASLTLGFLSFTGAFAIWPVVWVGALSFVLSVAYEGEIYLRNIKEALNKLYYKTNYLKRHIAKEFLIEHFPDPLDENAPEFLHDYAKLLKLERHCKSQPKTAETRKRLKEVRKTIKQSEIYFTEILLPEAGQSLTVASDYEQSLRDWIKTEGGLQVQSKFQKHRLYYRIAAGFSAICALFMILGTVYLLASSLAIFALPTALLATIIGTGALFAGAAYGFLTFNSISDMINNDTLGQWLKKIKNDLSQNFGVRSVLMAVTALVLTGLGIVMTLLTAGTWWTIAKEAPRVFNWMKQVPGFITKLVMPFFLGLSSLGFNLENSAETMDHIDDFSQNKNNGFRQVFSTLWQSLKTIWKEESLLQLLNPFRLLLKLTLTPIRILLFLGHLISIALTSDRVPGIPEIVSALIGFVLEGFTDGHYFFEDFTKTAPQENHSQSEKNPKLHVKEHLEDNGAHDHNADIPSRLIQWCFYPVFAASTAWHFLFSPHEYSWERLSQCWNVHFASSNPLHPRKTVENESVESLSPDFKVNMALHRIQTWGRKEQVIPFSPEHETLKSMKDQLETSGGEVPLSEVLKEKSSQMNPRFFKKLNRLVEVDQTAEEKIVNGH